MHRSSGGMCGIKPSGGVEVAVLSQRLLWASDIGGVAGWGGGDTNDVMGAT